MEDIIFTKEVIGKIYKGYSIILCRFIKKITYREPYWQELNQMDNFH